MPKFKVISKDWNENAKKYDKVTEIVEADYIDIVDKAILFFCKSEQGYDNKLIAIFKDWDIVLRED